MVVALGCGSMRAEPYDGSDWSADPYDYWWDEDPTASGWLPAEDDSGGQDESGATDSGATDESTGDDPAGFDPPEPVEE